MEGEREGHEDEQGEQTRHMKGQEGRVSKLPPVSPTSPASHPDKSINATALSNNVSTSQETLIKFVASTHAHSWKVDDPPWLMTLPTRSSSSTSSHSTHIVVFL